MSRVWPNRNIPSDLASVGCHFLIGLQKSASLTDHDRRLLSVLQPAGVILFRENFKHGAPYEEWLTALRELLKDVRACIGRPKILISIDHEGGKVFRPPPPVTNFGPAASWAARSGEIGKAMGIELRSLGINLNYCPVVDIHTNPANPVIGNRALGTSAEAVTRSASNFLAAQEGEGVLGCPKHFPGHGDTSKDSHYDLPVVYRDMEELRQRELLPFAAITQTGAKIIMTAHILYPAIDPDHPATLSRVFLNDALRGELHFQGVITTDDIGMGAVSSLFAVPGAAVATLQAGCDLIMISAHWTDTERAIELGKDLLNGLSTGTLTVEALKASEDRVQSFLALAPMHAVQPLAEGVFAAHAALRA